MTGGRNGKGYGVLPPPLGASRFTTPLCTELSTFTHGRRLPYEADYFTRHCPPEYPPAPCPLAAGTGRRAYRPGAGGPCLPGLRATAAGVGSASMKKSKPEPILVMDYRQYAERGGWYMSAATMTAATVSRWTMGRNVSASSPFPTPCCAGGSGRRCCRWTGNWKRPCSTAWTPNGAPSAGRCSPRLQTGPNTARNVPDA